MNKLNFSAEYSQRGDDELLQLASDRFSLTSGAAAALDDELHQRHLTECDRATHQQFVRRREQREAGRQRRRIFGTRSDSGKWLDKWVDLFWALLAIVLISSGYIALPNRYHMRPDLQEAAVHVMFASVFIAVVARSWWRQIGFSMSLALVVCDSYVCCPRLDTARRKSPQRKTSHLARLCAVFRCLRLCLAVATEPLR